MPAEERTVFDAFSDRADAPGLAGFLAAMHAVPAVRRIKARSFELAGVGAGTAVLDVGCGIGVDLDALLERVGPGGRVVGVEPNPELAAAAARRTGAEVLVAQAEALPLDTGSFAAARADRVIHYVAEPARALAEMARVVAPGGAVVVTECRFELEGAPDPDPEVLAELERRVAGGQAGAPWLGAFLPVVFRRAGLDRVEVDWQEEVVGEPADVARCMNLEAAPADERTARWRAALDADLRAGRRCLRLTGAHFHVRVQ